MHDDPSVASVAGWYPDPVGAHELRYHNGTSWTGDVSTDGVRLVSPVPPAPSGSGAPGRDPSGTTPLVLGIITLSIGWIPFVSVVALVTGLVAIVIGLRRRRVPSARGSASAGVVLGAVGMALAVVGTWLAFLVVVAVGEFEDPGPYDAEITDCREVDEVSRASGTITNRSDGTRSYTIEVTFDGQRSEAAIVDDVAPGDTMSFVVDENFRFDTLDCEITSVKGPRPFGLDTGG